MNPGSGQEELKVIVNTCKDTLKQGGLVGIPSSIGFLAICDLHHSRGIQKLKTVSEKFNAKLFALANHDSKLIFLLDDIPPLTYDLLDQTGKPLLICFDHPLPYTEEHISGDNTLLVWISEDRFISRLGNLGIKAFAAIKLGTENQPQGIPSRESVLSELDYIVTLPPADHPVFSEPSIISLKMNGEIRIIRK